MTGACCATLDTAPETGPAAHGELEQAFHLFNELSRELSGTYRALELRVAELTAELARERGERLRELAAKELLANRLSYLLDALPAGVVVLDGEGIVREANPAAREFLGLSVTGQPWREIVARAFDRAGASHGVCLRDGRQVSIATCALGEEPGQIVLVHDVSELRALQERVARQERLTAMGEMAASLAHQIRTPLSTAMLYVSRLRGLQGVAGQAGERTQASLKHLEALVNDMLLFARGGAPTRQAIEVSALLADVVQSLEPAAAAGAKITVRNDGCGRALIHGNREALAGVVSNLITNAVQAGARAIDLTSSVESAALAIRIADDGPGVPAELRERIFEPFFTTRAQGTGLGLAVARAVARAHGGEIACTACEGGGAVFTLRIPTNECLVASAESRVEDTTGLPDSRLSTHDSRLVEKRMAV
jgi:two-component system sensor histidine kinase FlrB